MIAACRRSRRQRLSRPWHRCFAHARIRVQIRPARSGGSSFCRTAQGKRRKNKAKACASSSSDNGRNDNFAPTDFPERRCENPAHCRSLKSCRPTANRPRSRDGVGTNVRAGCASAHNCSEEKKQGGNSLVLKPKSPSALISSRRLKNPASLRRRSMKSPLENPGCSVSRSKGKR